MDSGVQGAWAWNSRQRSQRLGSAGRDLGGPGEGMLPPLPTRHPGREGRKSPGEGPGGPECTRRKQTALFQEEQDRAAWLSAEACDVLSR